MELRHTEKLIRDEERDDVFYSQMPVFQNIQVYMGSYKLDSPIIQGKRLTFKWDIPEDAELMMTYLTDDGNCGECLYLKDMLRKYYKMLLNVDDDAEIEGYDSEGVIDYLKDSLIEIQNTMGDYRSLRQYSFTIGVPMQTLNCMPEKYTEMCNIPKVGWAMTKDGIFLPYQVVGDEVHFEKQMNMDTTDAYFGYELPALGYITSVMLGGKPIEWKEYNGFYFFPKASGVVTITYYKDIVINEDCCIEFDKNFSRLPVLYALYQSQYDRGDPRADTTKQRYDMLMKQYKKYLRRMSGKDANNTNFLLPRQTYNKFNKRLTGLNNGQAL